MLIDTHAHIYARDFSGDRNEVIDLAISRGVEKIVMPAIDSSSADALMETAFQRPGCCYPLMGLHPTSVGPEYMQELDFAAEWFSKYRFYGVGETGIDLYWDKKYQKEQEDAFRQQLIMAKSFHLPVVIHVRNSFQEVFSILEKEQDGTLTGIFHCFSGSLEDASRVIAAGFYLGIGGVVTFANSQLSGVVREVDISHVVLETDAPWLSPVPKRGRRNECSYLVYIAEKVAGIYGISFEEAAEITTRNAMQIFKF
jgi:TatD DNase family protein